MKNTQKILLAIQVAKDNISKIEKSLASCRKATDNCNQNLQKESENLRKLQKDLEFQRYLHTSCYKYKVNG